MTMEPVHVDDPRRRRLVLLCAAPPIVLLMVTVLLIVATQVLDPPAFGGLSWAYVVCIAQFALTIVLGHIYIRRIEALERSPSGETPR